MIVLFICVLRSFIRQYLIKEAASTVDHADAMGLALYQSVEPDHVQLILFDPDAMLHKIRKLRGTDDYSIYPEDLHGNYIVGTINASPTEQPCHGAYEVWGPAAEYGFGPLLYDITMSLVPGRTTTSDKQGGTSTSARRVWNHYYHHRDDISKAPFDDFEDPQTPDPDDDCELVGDEVLDTAYTTRKKINTKSLRMRYKEFLERAEIFGVSKETVKDSLVRSAEIFFEDKYVGDSG